MPLKQIVFRGNGQHFSVQPTHLLQILRALGLITGSAERSGGHDGKSRAAEEESIGLHEHAEVPEKLRNWTGKDKRSYYLFCLNLMKCNL